MGSAPNAEESVSVAIVGCGGISSRHGDAVVKHENSLELVACCDIDDDAATKFAETYDVSTTYADYRAMLDAETVDIVVLATWPNLHEEQVFECIDAGVPAVLCEKSLALDGDSAARMASAAETARVLLVEGFMYRHHPRILRTQEKVADGTIGSLRSLRAVFHWNGANLSEHNWRQRPELGGGVVFDQSCYCVNAISAFTSSPPQQVAATCTRREDGLIQELYATLVYPGGVVAQIASSQTANYRQTFELHGTDGTLFLENAWSPGDRNREDIRPAPEEPTKSLGVIDLITGTWAEDLTSERIAVEAANPYERQLVHVARCLQDKSMPRFSITESVRNHYVIDALLESAAEDRFVTPHVSEEFA